MRLATNPSSSGILSGLRQDRHIEQKRMVFIFIILLLFVPLIAQTKIPESKKFLIFQYDQKTVSISPLIAPIICFGFGSTKISSNQRFTETFVQLNVCESFSIYKQYGIAFRTNQFFSRNKKSGLFWIMNAGLDYVQMRPLCLFPDGSNCDDDELDAGIIPNLSTGLGYSIKIGQKSYLRLECDIGMKWIISNIYLSFVW
ncbi:MAG TPA: hypothetical protein PLD62_09260 [Candidatus Cloacimonadota bacterium]|nr:hypothetical protein [Candidatus Cloacimonadota bacterium]